LPINYIIRIFLIIIRAMSIKLTLLIEKSVIEKAKSYAKKTGRSLSELVENYLELITKNESDIKISPKLKRIVGAVKLPKNFDEDKELRENLEKKYL
jgi:formiminotetrahydrofolate cyclodeaminase